MNNSFNALISPLSIAPMIDWTYTHFRVFMRLLMPEALLYTEMQTIGAIRHNPTRSLYFHPAEKPLALQLGGNNKKDLIEAALIAEEKGFAEVNLNLGCPSDKVQAGRFGACLMAEPELVADCIASMKAVVNIPVTAKTRIGIDDFDSYEFFASFVKKLVEAGADKLIVHARKAWLTGLNPKQNRTIPPLHYDYAYKIKADYPQLPVVINGNISFTELNNHMQKVDGVMLGRLAYQNPYLLTSFYEYFYPNYVKPSRTIVLENYVNYCCEQFEQGLPLSLLLKPIFNLGYGLSRSKIWKEELSLAMQNRDLNRLRNVVRLMEEIENSFLDGLIA